jgi:HK97 family phage prohead protease
VEYKTIALADYELKAGSDGWSFTAYASTFGNRDHGGDIIQKGAFQKTLKDPNRDRPLLWQHMMSEPIGSEISLREDSKGLLGQWELVDTQRGADAYKLLKKGVVRSMSIGYMPTAFEFDDGGETRILNEIDLLENSVVSIPMNDQARIQTVKHICTTCESKAADYTTLNFADLSKLLAEVSGVFGERTKTLLEKLEAGDHELTGSKSDDLHALLETFSGLDAVRSTAEALVQRAPAPKDETVEDPGQSSRQSYMALALELRRRKLRAAGVEV